MEKVGIKMLEMYCEMVRNIYAEKINNANDEDQAVKKKVTESVTKRLGIAKTLTKIEAIEKELAAEYEKLGEFWQKNYDGRYIVRGISDIVRKEIDGILPSKLLVKEREEVIMKIKLSSSPSEIQEIFKSIKK